MLCEKCKKREANVHLKQIINNSVLERHLCQNCAQEEGLMFANSFNFNAGNIFSGFFSGFNNFFNDVPMPTFVKNEVKCPLCGMSFEEFQETGKLGCGECYTQFEKNIAPVLQRIHGNTLHVGSVPENVQSEIKTKRRISELKTQLQKAILNEEYEKAAMLRDQIKELEG